MDIQEILPLVRKPARYIGNEIGAFRKDWKKSQIKFAVAYPDVYDIGMSNLGIRIIYDMLNKRGGTLCERVFAPWTDMELWLRKERIPLCSLESHIPLSSFDVIAFSLQSELTYTNILTMLELGGIPIYSKDRDENSPLVIGGGLCTFNPLPIADFFDLFGIGEAEAILPKLIAQLKDCKKNGLKRDKILMELSKVPGIYVPSINNKVERQFINNLDAELIKFVIPFVATTHDRFVVQIARGCTRGCRFCQPGIVTRPYRELPATAVLELARTGLESTGYDEVSFLSLSASDHSQIDEIIRGATSMFQNTKISLPSLRGDSLDEANLKAIGSGGITFAPETGTTKLRRTVNKEIKEPKILESCDLATRHGFTHIKLYYMIGLPNEDSNDIQGIVDLTKNIARVSHGKKITVSISPFVPRPHTPFQWERQESGHELLRKIAYIRNRLRRKNIQVKYRDPQISLLEGIFSRGGRELSTVIECAWKNGSRMDEWSESFNFREWLNAFDANGIDPNQYLSERPPEELLPWEEVISIGVTREYLLAERSKSSNFEETQDCRIIGCTDCGVCPEINLVPMKRDRNRIVSYGRSIQRKVLTGVEPGLRVKFKKGKELRFISHLDLIRLLIRAIRRANIPVAYSKGHRPRPKISFSPPIPLGMTAKEDYFDVRLERPMGIEFINILNETLPDGIEILEVYPIYGKEESLSSKFKVAIYRAYNIKVADKKIKEYLSKRKECVNIKNGDGFLEITMLIGKLKPYEVLKEILNIPYEEVLKLHLERTMLCKSASV
jgi:radical SAM superfamily enzyme YgiQ (UPF0313 family)